MHSPRIPLGRSPLQACFVLHSASAWGPHIQICQLADATLGVTMHAALLVELCADHHTEASRVKTRAASCCLHWTIYPHTHTHSYQYRAMFLVLLECCVLGGGCHNLRLEAGVASLIDVLVCFV